MATVLKTPGVYVEEISTFPPSVAQVATAIPAFIGFTEKALYKGEDVTNTPTRISSLLEYEETFGVAQLETGIVVTITDTTADGTPAGALASEVIRADFANLANRSGHTMYYALQAYFANGGGPCWIVSVGGYGAVPGVVTLAALQVGLARVENEDEPTLIVFPEQQALSTAEQLALIQAALDQCGDLQDRFVIANLHVSGEGMTTAGDVGGAATDFRALANPNLKYGAVYFPNIRTVFDYRYEDGGVTIAHTRNGVAGAGPHDGNTVDTLEAPEGALYARVQSALGALPVTMAPSGAIAGIYARVDESRGVWKAPANEALSFVTGFTFKVTDAIQEDLNVDTTAGKSINALRTFTGRGNLVWGARTLDGNSNEWRYISVRRFFNMVEESTKKASGRFVFEPNDLNTWVKVRAMIENFLLLQWRAGALQGAKPEQAFFVKVGLGETMSALDVLEGRMIVEIGMAVVRPAEFIILRFTHKMPEA